MDVWEIALIGVALAMDACAVAMTDGMTDNKMPVWRVLLVGVFFGVFQFLMPIIGYYITGVIADAFLGTFEKIAAWISFVLLAFLGGKMLFECIAEKIKETIENEAYYKTLKENCKNEKKNILSVEDYCDILIEKYEKLIAR